MYYRDGSVILTTIATTEVMKESNVTPNTKHVHLKNSLARISNASENSIDVIVSSCFVNNSLQLHANTPVLRVLFRYLFFISNSLQLRMIVAIIAMKWTV
jgi:hypothetical protein